MREEPKTPWCADCRHCQVPMEESPCVDCFWGYGCEDTRVDRHKLFWEACSGDKLCWCNRCYVEPKP